MDNITIYTMQRITDVQADVIVEPVMEQISKSDLILLLTIFWILSLLQYDGHDYK